MLLKLFKSNHPVVYIYLLCYALLLKGSYFFIPFPLEYSINSIAGKWIFNWLEQFEEKRWLIHLIAILMVYLQAIILNGILARYQLFGRQTFIPAFIYITLSSLLPGLTLLNPAMIACFFVLPFISNLLQIPQQDIAVENLFFTAFYVSLGSLFYFPVSFLLLVILYALIVLKTPVWREFFIIIFGFLLPYLFLGIYFFVDNTMVEFLAIIWRTMPADFEIVTKRPEYLLIVALVVILVILGYFKSLEMPQQNVILYRKYLGVFIAFSIFGTMSILLVKGTEVVFSYLLLIPITVFVANIYDAKKVNIFYRIIFFLLLGTSIYYQLLFNQLMRL